MSYCNSRMSENDILQLKKLQNKVQEIQNWLIKNINHPDFSNKLSEQRIYLFKIAKIKSDSNTYKPKIYDSNIIIHPIKQV